MPCYADKLSQLPAPNEFYKTFVKPRRPVLLQGCASALHPAVFDHPTRCRLTVEKLLEIVGEDAKDDLVEVNQRNNDVTTEPSSFSPQHSTIVTMSFADFCRKLQNTRTEESSQYYLTTQTLPLDEEGRPALYTTPVKQLLQKTHIPLRPALLGNLVPMTCNLWMGRGGGRQQPSQSGLHHDFHDNLYCLWQGHKSFRIAPPTSPLPVAGVVHTLHPNGRFVYQEQIVQQHKDGGLIRPDGALVKVERIMELELRREKLEQRMLLLSDRGDRQESAELEQELDGIEKELLDLEVDGEEEGQDDELLFGGGKSGDVTDEDGSDLDNENASEDNEPLPKKRKTGQLPCNFVVKENAAVEFDTIEMTQGDLLYLPAGWFHEVSSRGQEGGLHIAFNYWMHPPDACDGTDFDRPYLSKFWQRDFDARNLK